MPSSNTHPDQFVNNGVVVSTTDAAGTIGTAGLDFTFDASHLFLVNDKATSVYVSLDSTSGSTGGLEVKTTSGLQLDNLRIGRMSLASTSTSTGTFVRVAAWGGP